MGSSRDPEGNFSKEFSPIQMEVTASNSKEKLSFVPPGVRMMNTPENNICN